MAETKQTDWYNDKYPYKIGGAYSYYGDEKVFVLASVNLQRGVFHFECGHSCTDSVFEDLIDLETGIQGYQWEYTNEPIQLQLF